MVKKTTLLLTFLAVQFVLTASNASCVSSNFEKNNLKFDLCDIPAPDSFHVTRRGSTFIDIAWKPIYAGAVHTLFVFINTSTGNGCTWTPIDTFYNVSGSTFTVNNVAFDAECKFLLATNCASGEASINKAELFDKIIFEVTTAGRNPINPMPVPCTNINLTQHNWVGFSVSHLEDGQNISNLFEFRYTVEAGQKRLQIKRVFYPIPIVAVDYIQNWPTVNEPELAAPNPFEMVQYSTTGMLDRIGFVDLNVYFPFPAIDLCIAISDPKWDRSYRFKPLVANAVVEEESLGKQNRDKDINLVDFMLDSTEKVKIKNPFNKEINLFIDRQSNLERIIFITLFDLNGKKVFEKQFLSDANQLSIAVPSLPKGLYILNFTDKNSIQSFKVIKTE
jgi:hypothetical protein